MTDLASWLLEQIAEDEALARETQAVERGQWKTEPVVYEAVQASTGIRSSQIGYVRLWNGTGQAIMRSSQTYDACVPEHIVRWQPARVLAECEAKREVIARWQRENDDQHTLQDVGIVIGLREAVRYLAVPYADRPGYLDEWRP